MAEEHGRLFDLAFREAQKAWHATPMLARTQADKARALVQVVNEGHAHELSTFLAEVAGPSFASSAVSHGVDAEKVGKLGKALVHMALLDRPRPQRSGGSVDVDSARAAVAALGVLKDQLRGWVAHGCQADMPELWKVDQLVKGKAEARLSLAAPLAPALGVCLVVAQAMAAGYPLCGAAAATHAPERAAA
jgi:hypothetical protein